MNAIVLNARYQKFVVACPFYAESISYYSADSMEPKMKSRVFLGVGSQHAPRDTTVIEVRESVEEIAQMMDARGIG